MTGLFISSVGQVFQNALAELNRTTAWPDPASGFAYRLLKAAGCPCPSAFSTPPRTANAQLLRRAPELAAFGYVMGDMAADMQAEWAGAYGRLMGREVYPADRNSFVYNPLELIGVASGVTVCPACDDAQRGWLVDTIARGIAGRQFTDVTAQAAAVCAVGIIAPERISVTAPIQRSAILDDLKSEEILLLAALECLFPCGTFVDPNVADDVIAARVISTGVPVHDTAEVAALYLSLDRVIGRSARVVDIHDHPLSTVIALCRRFPLFVARLQARQRQRDPYRVKDEYDVQDLLHAILKLHFDDVRPEEWTPSYAGNASRTDFLLPEQKILIEAKMTRQGLGQREVTDELLIDAARYSKMPNVEHLVCIVYDPDHRCPNPAAIENDLARTDGRLRVTAVVCPRGT
jgi:hypothetical protein